MGPTWDVKILHRCLLLGNCQTIVLVYTVYTWVHHLFAYPRWIISFLISFILNFIFFNLLSFFLSHLFLIFFFSNDLSWDKKYRKSQLLSFSNRRSNERKFYQILGGSTRRDNYRKLSSSIIQEKCTIRLLQRYKQNLHLRTNEKDNHVNNLLEEMFNIYSRPSF
jgi:hypothetical protein